MWNRQKHCSDEQLLAHADGELFVITSAWVKRHLNVCWDCRTRLSELDDQTQLLAKALREDSLLSPARTSEARARFHEWRLRFEERFVETAPRFSYPRFSLRTGVLAGAGLCAIVLAVWAGASRKTAPAKTDVSEILARTQTAERSLYQSSLLVHQTFRVRMTQIQPDRLERDGQIEIWSDSDGHRFASRWRDSSGALRHAVWRPGRGRDYLYNPAVAPGVVEEKKKPSSPTFLLGDLPAGLADVDKLETELRRWIENRQWRPIALSTDFNTFASQDGAILRSKPEEDRICLQAERVSGTRRIEFSLELEKGSYKPLLQRVRIENAGRVIEMELAAGDCEFISSARSTPGIFEPEGSLIAARHNPVPRQRVVPDLEPGQESYSDAGALAALEIEARYALHRLRACMGEPIEVARVNEKGAASHIEVRGLVESEARKAELRMALAELASVQLRIRTAEEALKTAAPEFRPLDRAGVTIRENGVRLSSGRSPIQQELKELLGGGQGIAVFSTHAISLSQGALTHAWALRRLAERYDRETEVSLLPRSRWLLEIMTRDHRVALETDNRRTLALLEPVLKHVQNKLNLQILRAPDPVNWTDRDWQSMTRDTFETTDQIDKLTRRLFAAADPLQDGPGDSKTLDSDLAQDNVRDLIGAFQRLELLLSAMQTSDSENGF